MDPESIGSEALATYDKNDDGALSGEELDACPGLKHGLRRIDLDQDGRATAEEIAARIRQYQEANLGMLPAFGAITLDGNPLEGALVTLVPEDFMGGSIEPAQATTDAGGQFKPKTEGVDPRLFGARAGMYRITVSKKDAGGNETIPANYNSQTTLGMEVGSDSPVVGEGLELALRSTGD